MYDTSNFDFVFITKFRYYIFILNKSKGVYKLQ